MNSTAIRILEIMGEVKFPEPGNPNLPVLDNFTEVEKFAVEAAYIKGFFKGVDITYKQWLEAVDQAETELKQ